MQDATICLANKPSLPVLVKHDLIVAGGGRQARGGGRLTSFRVRKQSASAK